MSARRRLLSTILAEFVLVGRAGDTPAEVGSAGTTFVTEGSAHNSSPGAAAATATLRMDETE